jgi:fructose-1,6-bisphosphatase II
LFDGVERTRDQEKTQTLMIAGPGGERQILTTWHPRLAGQ